MLMTHKICRDIKKIISIYFKINYQNGIKLAFSTVALLLSARNKIYLWKIKDNLQTYLGKLS